MDRMHHKPESTLVVFIATGRYLKEIQLAVDSPMADQGVFQRGMDGCDGQGDGFRSRQWGKAPTMVREGIVKL